MPGKATKLATNDYVRDKLSASGHGHIPLLGGTRGMVLVQLCGRGSNGWGSSRSLKCSLLQPTGATEDQAAMCRYVQPGVGISVLPGKWHLPKMHLGAPLDLICYTLFLISVTIIQKG